MAAVAAALVFQTIFAPEAGVVNALFGVDIAWDQDAVFGKLAVIALRSWHSIGWFFVIFLAGLTTINPELYDAAKVDGARAWQSLWSITIPLMRPTFLFAIVTISIYSLRMFAEPNLLFSTGIAPARFQPIMNQLYLNLRAGQFGSASAVAWLIFIPIVVVSVIQFRLLRGDVKRKLLMASARTSAVTTAPTRSDRRYRGNFTLLGAYSILAVAILLSLFPFGLMVLNSFKDNTEVFRNPGGWPREFTLESYRQLFSYQGNQVLRSFFNSVFIAATSTIHRRYPGGYGGLRVCEIAFPWP